MEIKPARRRAPAFWDRSLKLVFQSLKPSFVHERAKCVEMLGFLRREQHVSMKTGFVLGFGSVRSVVCVLRLEQEICLLGQ